MSAAGIAAAMGRPRQVVNYHVRELARAGFLKAPARARKRGLTEQRYVVSAQAYVLAPEVLGALDATATDPATADKASAAYLLMLATRLQRELSESWRKADAGGHCRCRCSRSIPSLDSPPSPIALASRRRSPRRSRPSLLNTPRPPSASPRGPAIVSCSAAIPLPDRSLT